MKLTINSLDLGYTIDTYGMFNGDGADESEAEYYRDEYNLTDDELQQIDFDYNHKGVVTDLAEWSVELLGENLTDDGIVEGITLAKTSSPKFYNYTTDGYTAEWTVNETKLQKYCLDNAKTYEAFVKELWDYEYCKAIEGDDFETQMVIALDFYTRNVYSTEGYEESMFEHEYGVWYENMELTPEAQAMIDAKQVEMDLEADRIKNQTKLDLEG